ncbi:MAG: hypothetical protein EHM66_00350 [Deltaproteobacteria bacterium]|nr:MAG: hypothetical protein EHM66_00350 [Deltaproteobacteria bacterium]
MPAVLLGNFVWESISTDPWPEIKDGAKNGHILKLLDTGESYIRRHGIWEYINLGLSFIKATKSGSIVTDDDGYARVNFVTPFINIDYSVCLTPGSVGFLYICYFSDIQIGGFDIYTNDARTGRSKPNVEVSWLATRNYNP